MMKRIAYGIPLVVALAGVSACSKGITGQSSFISAPPAGQGGGSNGGLANGGAGGDTGGQTAPSAPGAGGAGGSGGGTSTPRTVQETDLYRLEGNRLYYLNSYR